jgi:hypothetical protein
MRLKSHLISPPPSSDVVIANSGPVHSLAELREEWIKNLDDSAVRYFSVPDSLFIHRFEQIAKESWQQAARKMEAEGWGTDPRYSDREFAESLLRVLGRRYGNDLENILDEAINFVKKVRASSNPPGRIVTCDEVQKAQLDPNSKFTHSSLALRFVTLMQVEEGDGFSWELIEGWRARASKSGEAGATGEAE